MTIIIAIMFVFVLFMVNLTIGLCKSAKIADEQLEEIHKELDL